MYITVFCGVIILLIIMWFALGFLLIHVSSSADRFHLPLCITLDMMTMQIESLVMSLLFPR